MLKRLSLLDTILGTHLPVLIVILALRAQRRLDTSSHRLDCFKQVHIVSHDL